MFDFRFYESLACVFGRDGGGDISTEAGIDGDKTVLRSRGLLLFEYFRLIGSAFRAGIIAASAQGGAIGSGFDLIVLTSCPSFAKSVFTCGSQSESSAFRPAISHGTSSTFMLPSAIAVRRPAASDST
jgi:hypothetical protein